ncbi:MAG: SGNH/GDSL hydrolase family protein [Planctomycetes bacterium]|nr:SGNH/GDSL hydrolase family protein [Planctomycetota bacterium]
MRLPLRRLPAACFERYVAIGDSSTEGLEDADGAGGYRGWANRLAERIAEAQGGLLYANLGVRGLRAREIREGQLGPALEMKPDLATVFAGSNDMLDRDFDPHVLQEEVARMQGALVAAGAVVLTFTLPDLTGVMPIGRLLARRVRAMNDALKQASARTGARLVDFAAHPVGSDPRLWTEDRFHVNAEGHARIAAALAQALGLPGTDDAWSRPLPGTDARGRLKRWSETCRWFRRHLLRRVLSGNPPSDAFLPKRPRLEPVIPRG